MKINQAFTILQNAGGIRAARIITENTKNLSRLRVWRYARALRRGVPVAKIIGQKWFYGLKFHTNRHTLDPRPDTETLVAAVIADCGANDAPNILDLGTGTGCIIGALVKKIFIVHVVLRLMHHTVQCVLHAAICTRWDCVTAWWCCVVTLTVHVLRRQIHLI